MGWKFNVRLEKRASHLHAARSFPGKCVCVCCVCFFSLPQSCARLLGSRHSARIRVLVTAVPFARDPLWSVLRSGASTRLAVWMTTSFKRVAHGRHNVCPSGCLASEKASFRSVGCVHPLFRTADCSGFWICIAWPTDCGRFETEHSPVSGGRTAL